MQEGHPLAYLSKPFNLRSRDHSIYEEFLAEIMAMTKWHHYLEGQRFIIKDHKSLKQLSQQKTEDLCSTKGYRYTAWP
uniref:Reverse transcriptase RNase H-like domain-containing protein n=1 Tax=Rhizophora mucronata TaxID=61149 RepID=A0A2P2P2H5_RHIMU